MTGLRRWSGIFLLGVVATVRLAAADFLAARALYDAREYSAARAAFAALARTQPENADIEFHLGRLALWFDDEDAALAHLQCALRLAPRDARVHNALGDAYGLAAQNANVLAKLGWARKCRAAYERAIELDPTNPAWRWSLLGFCYLAPRIAGGGLDKAHVQAAEILKLDPLSGRIARATLALAEKRHDAAFAEFDRVLRESPDDFVALYHIGRCAALSGRNLQRGVEALRRCLELPPPTGDGMPTPACVHHRLGNILELSGDARGAQEAYATARRLHPDFRADKIALKN